jgi:hypothetical protein
MNVSTKHSRWPESTTTRTSRPAYALLLAQIHLRRSEPTKRETFSNHSRQLRAAVKTERKACSILFNQTTNTNAGSSSRHDKLGPGE